jgi:2-dehydropantoate 2-reductase
MNILVCGAGVIGSLYAARLKHAGHQVTLLARGSRLAEIQQHGLTIEDLLTGSRQTVAAEAVDQLSPTNPYDLAIVAVRYDQLPALLPTLAANTAIPKFLFLLNNPLCSEPLVEALGASRVLLGFPGAGGTLEAGVVRYAIIKEQPTTIGVSTPTSPPSTLQPIAQALQTAGFPTRIDTDMDAWLCAHAFFITSICGAIYRAGGDCAQLSRDRSLLNQMLEAIREGFRAVGQLGMPVHPFALKVLFLWMPRFVAFRYWANYLANPNAEYIFGRHARHASGELRALADACRLLLAKTSVPTPALDQLLSAIDAYAAAHAVCPRSRF